jgi:hypothetical protein
MLQAHRRRINVRTRDRPGRDAINYDPLVIDEAIAATSGT